MQSAPFAMLMSGSRMLAETAFWLSAAVLLYVYIGYPLMIWVIALFTRQREADPAHCPSISILIAAYNEEANIGRKLEQTLSLDYPAERMEILVLSDCSSDRTDEIVQNIKDTRVKLLRMLDRRGKTYAQNQGALAAKGDILIFSDATTTYHPQALRLLAANYKDQRVGAVSGRYQYFDPGETSPTGLGTVAFWNYENFIKKLQSRIKTISGCCGCIYSVRRNLYTALSADIISDLVQPLRVIQKGYRVVFEDRALAYEETTQSAAEEFSMRVRVVTRAIRGVMSVPDLFKPWKYPWISFQLISHKILRWLVAVFLILLFVANSALLGNPLYRALFLAQVLFYCFALACLFVPLQRLSKVFSIPLYFCTLNAAALLSMIEVCRGKKYVIWNTVRNPS